MRHKAAAIAHSNIALIKYWGKRGSALNLPAVGSISVTLKELFTQTQVHFDPDLKQDLLILNGKRAACEIEQRARNFLDLIRLKTGIKFNAEIVSHNNFPTGAGLASSASAFAALALAASKAAGKTLTRAQLCELARRGSGSAARSIFGGFVEMKMGRESNGSDAIAIKLADHNYWHIVLLIVITDTLEKDVGSTQGMNHTENSSPYYSRWIKTSANDLKEMRLAIKNRDFEKMGELAEYSCLKMHALCFSARPALIYWNHLTVELMHCVRKLRNSGLPAYFTIDAGPQVKVITLPEYTPALQKELQEIPGIKKIIETGLGPDAKLVEVSK
jgi:diphosphomevalonate decarboxylase